MSPDQLRQEIAASFEIVKDRSSDDEICVVCPVPGCGDKSGNRHINVKTLYTHCWRCSAKQPHHVKGLFYAIGLEFQDNYVLEPDDLLKMLRGNPKKALTPIQEVILPDEFELLSENRKSCYWRFCREMAERKHLSIEDLEAANAGFTREGDWEPFCIFPVTEGPRTVYYQGRRYSDEGIGKNKKFPSKKIVPYGMSYWVYGLDDLALPSIELVIIVESILNRLSLKRRLRDLDLHESVAPICVFTHRISRPQVAKLSRYRHIKEWCFLFDSDSTELANETALALNAIVTTSVAEMPHGQNADGSIRKTNDANDDVDAALIAVKNRRRSNPDYIHGIKTYPRLDRPWPVAS